MYFGEVLIKNSQTEVTKLIKEIIFHEGQKMDCINLRAQALKTIRPKNRLNWEIVKTLPNESTKVGITIY